MKKLLFAVDDKNLFLELENTLLNRSNLQVLTAASGQEAIEIHGKEKTDLILCDLHLSDMSGDEVCRRIRSDEALKKVSIIMVTTTASQDDIERCLKAGANDCIQKPINLTELLKKVSKYITIPVRIYIHLFVRIKVEGTTDSSLEKFIGTTINISAGGFLIETGYIFNIGDAASFSLTIPDSPILMRVTGEVIRKAQGAQPHMNYYGVRFLEIKEEDKQAIENYIKSHPEHVI